MQLEHLGSRADLEALSDRVARSQEPIVGELQRVLDSLEGCSFETLEESREVTATINDLLDRLGLMVSCPKVGCGEPSRLLCHGGTTSRLGSFQFSHRDSASGKWVLHLGVSRLPKLTLVSRSKGRMALKR